MFSFGADAQTARVAGEFYLNAINVMRGAEAVSAYQPIPESEKFRIEYWELEEAKLRRRLEGSKPRPLGAFYARRTLLKQEVLPEHVAAAVLALCGGDLPLTTGLLIPVDAGVAAAFLR
jgi:hypothetical protein